MGGDGGESVAAEGSQEGPVGSYSVTAVVKEKFISNAFEDQILITYPVF